MDSKPSKKKFKKKASREDGHRYGLKLFKWLGIAVLSLAIFCLCANRDEIGVKLGLYALTAAGEIDYPINLIQSLLVLLYFAFFCILGFLSFLAILVSLFCVVFNILAILVSIVRKIWKDVLCLAVIVVCMFTCWQLYANGILISKVVATANEVLRLESIEIIDPFDYVDVDFSGVSGDATAVVKQRPRHNFLTKSMYSLKQSEGLANGDTVTAYLNQDILYDAMKNGYIISSTQQTYEVSGLREPVRSLSEISFQSFMSLQKESERLFWRSLDEQATDAAGLNINLEYMGAYYYFDENDLQDNYLHIVYQVDVAHAEQAKSDASDLCYYYCVIFKELSLSDGNLYKTTVHGNNPSFVYDDISYSGYQTLDELNKTTPLYQSSGEEYSCEASVASSDVVYTGQILAPYYPSVVEEIPETLQLEMKQTAQDRIERYVSTWDYPKTFKSMELVGTRIVETTEKTGNIVFLLYQINVYPSMRGDNLSEFYYFVAFSDVCRDGYESWSPLSSPMTTKDTFMNEIYWIATMEFITYKGYETLDDMETAIHFYEIGKKTTFDVS